MTQVVSCWSLREMYPELTPEMKCRCTNCGADLWHISQSGEVFCADCDEPSTQHSVIKNDF